MSLPGVCTDAETIEEGMQEIRHAIEGAVRLTSKIKTVPETNQKKSTSRDRLPIDAQ